MSDQSPVPLRLLHFGAPVVAIVQQFWSQRLGLTGQQRDMALIKVNYAHPLQKSGRAR